MTVKTNHPQVAEEILAAERGSPEHRNRGDIAMPCSAEGRRQA
jgi:hypothetical protein